MDSKEQKDKFKDLFLIQGKTQDGEGAWGIRARDENVEIAEIRGVKEGQYIGSSELVQLHPTVFPGLFGVEVLFDGRKSLNKKEKDEDGIEERKNGNRGRREGPPRISTDAYREGWERIFGGGKSSDDNLLN